MKYPVFLFIALTIITSNGFTNSHNPVIEINHQAVFTTSYKSSPNLLLSRSIKSTNTKLNIRCGLSPSVPPGCVLGACICDQYAENCHWTLVCNN